MKATCNYCHGVSEEGATKCANCGAPLEETVAVDFRFCPHCQKRLLALGSPACSYCGRGLPENYVKAREAMWQRIKDVNAGGSGAEQLEALENETDDDMRRALKALFDMNNSKRRG